MTLYEQHLGRPMTLGEQIPEREFYCNLCLHPESLKWRKKLEETTKQLKLEL